jgi:hypothetical protein
MQLVKTRNLITDAQEALAAESPMTLRQLFYRLVSSGLLENSRADYQRLSRGDDAGAGGWRDRLR